MVFCVSRNYKCKCAKRVVPKEQTFIVSFQQFWVTTFVDHYANRYAIGCEKDSHKLRDEYFVVAFVAESNLGRPTLTLLLLFIIILDVLTVQEITCIWFFMIIFNRIIIIGGVGIIFHFFFSFVC